VFAGLALLVGPALGTVLLSASELGTSPRPRGSHPALDPLWSTNRTRIVHVGADRERSEKVRRIARDQWALDRLKVCWQADTPRNCGRCSKCLVTMTLLHAAGALERCDRFDSVLTAAAVRAIALSPEPLPTVPSSVVDIFRVLPHKDADLRAAWAAVRERLERDGFRRPR
jgi:hypothetical protein